jgi:hypothetical protein
MRFNLAAILWQTRSEPTYHTRDRRRLTLPMESGYTSSFATGSQFGALSGMRLAM